MKSIQELGRGFANGKRYLEQKNFILAIKTYNELIQALQSYKSYQFNKVMEVSYNNRGVAKCELALVIKNAKLYEDGLYDFESSIALSDIRNDHERQFLVAFGNLRFGRIELNAFKDIISSNVWNNIL